MSIEKCEPNRAEPNGRKERKVRSNLKLERGGERESKQKNGENHKYQRGRVLDYVKRNMKAEKSSVSESSCQCEGSYDFGGVLRWNNSEANDRSSDFVTFVASNTRMVRICVSSPPLCDKSELFLFDFNPDLDLRSGEAWMGEGATMGSSS